MAHITINALVFLSLFFAFIKIRDFICSCGFCLSYMPLMYIYHVICDNADISVDKY